MISEDIVIISDEPVSDKVSQIDTVSKITGNCNVIETIVLDDDKITEDVVYIAEGKQTNDECQDDVIEVIDVDSLKIDKTHVGTFDSLLKENKKLFSFIEKCLDLENSVGMLRVINKTLLPIYNEMDEAYKMSAKFDKLLLKMTCLLDTDPNHKFSHLKNFCEAMKSQKLRKRAVLHTLASNLKDTIPSKKKRKKKRIYSSGYRESREPKINQTNTDIIDLVDDQACNENDDTVEIGYINNLNVKPTKVTNISTETTTASINNGISQENNLLVAQKELAYDAIDAKMQRIKYIEERIKILKNNIEVLEEQEVENDYFDSPYIQCDRFKSLIVKLYRELCKLTGEEAVKRREVRLHLKNDRLQRPVQKLEQLINENIGRDGNPHFPDFCDVVNCVHEANETENLGWSTAEVMNEARTLFTYCGRAIQKNRQKREWRDLMSCVQFKLEEDPANEDPLLLSRLEENRRIAMKKETDLLDRFVKLENSPSVLRPTTDDMLDSDDSDDVSIYEKSEVHTTSDSLYKNGDKNMNLFDENNEKESECIGNNKEDSLRITTVLSSLNNNNEQNSLITNNIINRVIEHSSQENDILYVTKEKIVKNNENLGALNENSKETLSNNEESDIFEIVNNTNVVKSLYNTKKVNENEVIEHNKNNSRIITNNMHDAKSPVDSTGVDENNYLDANRKYSDTLVKIKVEDGTEDTMRALASLGNSFTTTILDIEDPFLVIEISSDSDSSDSENDEC